MLPASQGTSRTATEEEGKGGGGRRRIQRPEGSIREERRTTAGGGEEGMIRRFGASGNPRILGGVVVSSQSIYRSSESENYIYIHISAYI